MNNKMIERLTDSKELLESSGICEEYIKKIENLQTKLKNKELTISVIGQFKRGKTSFINAILKDDILPVGIIPVTSVVTKIQYGSGYATVLFKDGHEEMVSLDSLGAFISEQENPVNKKGVSFVNLYLHYEFLKDGLIIVDTPGVGSMHQHNTDEAYSFMKDSDAIIFMLSVDSPINEIEREFLCSAKNHASKLYFIVNKIDTVSPSDLDAYMGYCHDILCEIMNLDTLHLAPISAKKNIGIDTLFSGILNDIKISVDDILIDSVHIKLREILTVALSHIEFYNTALNMPINNLEEKRIELIEKLGSLDQTIKEAFFQLTQKVEELIDNIRISLNTKSAGIVNDLTSNLTNSYEINRDKKPKQLEIALKSVLETDLHDYLNVLSEAGLSTLELGYENLVDFVNKKLDGLKGYLKEVIWELFGIDYHYEHTVHTLSENEDFYVRINDNPGAFLVDINDFIYLLPRNYANEKIAERFLKRMENDVNLNLTNMIHNYQYKIRESLRLFKYLITNESDALKKDIEDLVNRVITDKENTSVELGGKVEELNRIRDALRLTISEL
ncbi:MAG: dynamin family protein [Firmicutes bacterium]|nr:dynamin family protein [Bacillota bacterium]